MMRFILGDYFIYWILWWSKVIHRLVVINSINKLLSFRLIVVDLKSYLLVPESWILLYIIVAIAIFVILYNKTVL